LSICPLLYFQNFALRAAARLNQIQIVFSEGFDDGRGLERVRFVNPIAG
jgi:predicted nucleic acid-binding protein